MKEPELRDSVTARVAAPWKEVVEKHYRKRRVTNDASAAALESMLDQPDGA